MTNSENIPPTATNRIQVVPDASRTCQAEDGLTSGLTHQDDPVTPTKKPTLC